MKRQIIDEILNKAVLAPSADNLQPWKFRVREDGLDLLLDRARAGNFCDAGYLVPYLSAGAVIENIRAASAPLGYDIEARYLPAASDPLFVASLKWNERPAEAHPHEQAVLARATNRKFYSPFRAIPPEVYEAAEQAASRTPGVRMLWIRRGGAKYAALTRAVGDSDQLRFEAKRLHGELMSILRLRRADAEQSRDGLDFRTLETGPGGSVLFKMIASWPRLRALNRFGMSRVFNLYARLQMMCAQAAGLILTEAREPLDFIRGGEAMERVWHELTARGVAVQPMEALPIFIINLQLNGGADFDGPQKRRLEKLKNEFFSLFGIDDRKGLILLFRAGYASAPAARSLRRPVESFLI